MTVLHLVPYGYIKYLVLLGMEDLFPGSSFSLTILFWDIIRMKAGKMQTSQCCKYNWLNILVWIQCLSFLCDYASLKQSSRELSGHWQISIISPLLWPPTFCILIRPKKLLADCYLNSTKIYLCFGHTWHFDMVHNYSLFPKESITTPRKNGVFFLSYAWSH